MANTKMKTNTTNEYETAANDFLARNGLKFRATLSDSKTPAWAKEGEETGHHYRITLSRDGKALLAFSGLPSRLVFDFWGSIADARKLKTATEALKDYNWRQELARKEWAAGTGKILPDLSTMQENIRAQYQREIDDATPSAYDVLACISGDAYTPETFADFCAEYGYESDSIKALQQFRRCDRFAKRLRAFFTEKELTELTEIQ